MSVILLLEVVVVVVVWVRSFFLLLLFLFFSWPATSVHASVHDTMHDVLSRAPHLAVSSAHVPPPAYPRAACLARGRRDAMTARAASRLAALPVVGVGNGVVTAHQGSPLTLRDR